MEHFVEFEDVCKYYQTGSVKIAAADHLNFYVDKGEFCIIVGPSGAGKTTLLNILGGMDSCDEGNVWLDGQNAVSYTHLDVYKRQVRGGLHDVQHGVAHIHGVVHFGAGEALGAVLELSLIHIWRPHAVASFPVLSGNQDARLRAVQAAADSTQQAA